MNRISAVCWSVLRIGVPFDTYGSGSADPALFYTDLDHFSGSGSATLILIIFLLFLVRSPAGRYLAYGGGGLWSGVLLRGGRDCLLSARDDHAGQPHEGGGGGGDAHHSGRVPGVPQDTCPGQVGPLIAFMDSRTVDPAFVFCESGCFTQWMRIRIQQIRNKSTGDQWIRISGVDTVTLAISPPMRDITLL